MEALIRSYEKKNVFFLHTLGGDQDLSALHFKKHYRLNYPVIPDNLDRYRHLIRVTGITNVAVFGGDGVCVFNEAFMEGSSRDFSAVIDGALSKITGPNRRESAFIDGGTVYAPELKGEGPIAHQRLPALAAGPDGEVHLAYVSDAGGSNDVLLRSMVQGAWGKDAPVAATRADEYAPSLVALGKGQTLVAYVSNEKGRYDVHAALVKDGKTQRRWQVTRSPDDAMAPHLSCGEKAEPWLVWYEWAKMGPLSRDREVFAATLRGGAWSKPVQVSPREVPAYEDHADPVSAPDGRGGAWVAWAWDYHGTLKSKPPVDESSIFLRHLDRSMKLGEVLAAGFRGTGRARDYAPALATAADGTPWTAWDNSHQSSLGYNAKAIFVNRLRGEDFPEQFEGAASAGAIDSPRLIADRKGSLHLLWNQETREGWQMWRRIVGPGEPAAARRIEVNAKRPRYPSAAFDAKGNLWLAYVETEATRWEVRVEAVER
jgi:hypothetical protein